MTLSVSLRHAQPGGFTLDASFDAPAGLTVLFGPSGSGKTTIANAVAGLIRPNEGRIEAGGRVLFDSARGVFLPPHKRRLGYIFQEGRLFPHLTVRQNLGYGSWFAPRAAPRENLHRVIEMLGIGHLLTRRPAQLSGGEKQRVAIGRALLAAPELILADEPLAALDEPRKTEILPYFARLRDEVSIPILYVSHSAAEVARLATTVVVLENGRVTRQGSAAEVLGDPRISPTGVREVGAVLEARVVAHHEDGLSEIAAGPGLAAMLLLPRVPQAPGEGLRIRIAAHDVILATEEPRGLSARNILPGRIESIHSGGGPGAIVSLDTPAGRVLARITRRAAHEMGLAEGVSCYAVIKSVGVAPEDIGRGPAQGD